MSIRLTAVWPFLLFFIVAGVSAGLAAQASPASCRRTFFKDDPESWPPKSWDGYFKTFNPNISGLPLVERFSIRPATTTPPLQDARIYKLHQWKIANDDGQFVSYPNPSPELRRPDSDYLYVGGFTRSWDAMTGGISGEFIVVRSKEKGTLLTVPGLPRRAKGVSSKSYIRTLNTYLRQIERVAENGEEDPRLDYVFRILERQRSENSHADASVPQLNGSGLSLSRRAFEMRAKPDSHYERETVMTATFENGTANRVATRETFREGAMWVTVIDSYIERSSKKADAPIEEIKSGIAKRRKWIEEIVSVLYSDYIDRRKWTPEFIAHDFSEVLASADRTRYITVRADKEGRPGVLIAAMGLNRAPYENFTRMHDANRWDDVLVAAGSNFMRDFVGPAYAEKNDSESGHHSIHDLPILKMESYLGVHVDRPIAIRDVRWDTRVLVGGNIEINYPTFIGEGIIYEPVKFYLAPSSKLKRRALTELVSVLAESMIPLDRDPISSLSGQRLYTFNPLREGRLLYSPRGWKTDPNYVSVKKDGVEWHIFAESVEDFILKFHKLSPEDQETAAGEILRSLQFTAEETVRKRRAS